MMMRGASDETVSTHGMAVGTSITGALLSSLDCG